MTYNPVVAGNHSAILEISSTDSDENPCNITLSGVGTVPAAPQINVEDNGGGPIGCGGTYDFGTEVLSTINDDTIVIRNTGTATFKHYYSCNIWIIFFIACG